MLLVTTPTRAKKINYIASSMEKDNITYQYSKGSCVFYSLLLLGFIIWISTSVSDAVKSHDTDRVIFFGLIVFAQVVFLTIITIRYSIPAIRGRIALEINQQGIVDYTRNTLTEWADISDLRMAENKGDATIYLYFKRPDNSEDYKRIRLRWVKGDYLEIYGIIEANMEELSPRRS
jgi:hypothetical protein